MENNYSWLDLVEGKRYRVIYVNSNHKGDVGAEREFLGVVTDSKFIVDSEVILELDEEKAALISQHQKIIQFNLPPLNYYKHEYYFTQI